MMSYQTHLNNLFLDYRPSPNYPTYPPYHSGYYLEDYFYNQFISKNIKTNRFYIPIFWTTIYIQNQTYGLQEKLSNLNPEYEYFTVCQHDDAPREKLPDNCLVFSAGGNVRASNTIPIPLVCSSLPRELIRPQPKKYKASFVGSITHPIRKKLCDQFIHNPEYLIRYKTWNPSIGFNDLYDFIDITQQSHYAFCPRGYGLNSFRLYEAFQLNCVPVIITDKSYLPWQDELNWSEFSILIDENNLPHLDKILKNIDDEQYNKLLTTGKNLYSVYFTLNGTYDNIIKRLK